MLEHLLSTQGLMFLGVGAFVAGLNTALLRFLVVSWKIEKGWANLVALVVTLQVSFLLNNFVTFGENPAVSLDELFWRWGVYVLVRSPQIGLEQGGFLWLSRRFQVSYLWASLIPIVVLFLVSFLLSKLFIFV